VVNIDGDEDSVEGQQDDELWQGKWKKQNKIKYATWNVREMAPKEEELNSMLNAKWIKVVPTAESKKKKRNRRVQWKEIIT